MLRQGRHTHKNTQHPAVQMLKALAALTSSTPRPQHALAPRHDVHGVHGALDAALSPCSKFAHSWSDTHCTFRLGPTNHHNRRLFDHAHCQVATSRYATLVDGDEPSRLAMPVSAMMLADALPGDDAMRHLLCQTRSSDCLPQTPAVLPWHTPPASAAACLRSRLVFAPGPWPDAQAASAGRRPLAKVQ